MTPLQQFQRTHGNDWARIVTSDCFAAAVALATAEKIQKISELGDEEILLRGKIILADLRGHIAYESALLGLHERKELVFGQLGPEEYPDPVEEAIDEERLGSQDQEDDMSDTGKSLLPTPAPKKPVSPTKKKRKKKANT